MSTFDRHGAGRQAEIHVDPEVPLVRITRDFDAPAAKVFRAHVEPALLAQWLGPNGTETRIEHYDCRTGGSYRYLIARPGFEAGFFGSFHEVRPDRLIVQTFTFEGMADGVALERLMFDDLGDGRSRLIATSLVSSFADRDAFVASGMESGVQEGYLKLDAVLAAGVRP